MSRDIRVSLPAAIVYVSGSVNGKDNMELLKRHIVDEHIVSALQKA